MTSASKIIGYTERISVETGERVPFRVSCQSPSYRADLVRLIHGDPHPDGPGRKEELIDTSISGDYRGRVQEIHTGSYVVLPDAPLLGDLSSFTLQAWIYPTLPDRGWQGLLTRWDAAQESGYGLFIGEEGDIVVSLGNGSDSVCTFGTAVELQPHRWYFVAAVFDVEAGRLRLYQQSVVPWASDTSSVIVEQAADQIALGPSTAPFLMAASWDGCRTVGHYNGKIDAPVVFARALSPIEMDLLRQGRRAEISEPIAAWDFSLDISSAKVADTSPHGLNGETVNFPARGVTGHNWSGHENHWIHAPTEYGAIHFHSDDLEDVGWKADFELTVPQDLRSGVYAARVVSDAGEDRIPFFVRPKRGTATADLVFLAPTLTYLAYANEATLEVAAKRNADALFVPKSHGEIDQYVAENDMRSLYDRHLDGTGVYYASWHRPLTVRPDYYNRFRGYAHGLSADLHLLDWLEQKGVAYDVVTDHDLHKEGAELLSPYRVVITGGHPEYWTGPMLAALEQYQTHSGRLMYVGGNGFFGVTSVDPQRPHIAELRRVETNGFIWQAPAGERYHSTTGEFGGAWRSRGKSPHALSGVSCTAVGSDQAMPYHRQPGSFDPRAGFIFAGIGDAEVIGDFGLQQGAAGGDEVDRLDYAQGSPPHALVLATASGFSDVYLYFPEDVFYDQTYPSEPGEQSKAHPHVRADLVFFELPGGGAVFSTGSITWCGALSHNQYQNNVSRVTENVLRRFLDSTPFP
jgi:N,N-dimethylformamidase